MPVGNICLFSARKYTHNRIFTAGESLFGFDLSKLRKDGIDNRTDGCDFGV